MKKWFLISLFCPIFSSVAAENTSRLLEERVQVEIHGTTIKTQILQKWENTSSENISQDFLYPLGASAKNISFFVESEGRDFKVLEGKERLEKIFESAKKENNASIFRMGAETRPKLFTAGISLPARAVIQTKLSFETEADFITDFFFSEIFLERSAAIPNFEFSLSLEEDIKIYHFLSNAEDGSGVTNEKQRVLIFSRQNFTPENIFFLWSHVPTPQLEFPYQGYVYEAFFPENISPQKIRQAVFLLDRSGSMSNDAWKRTGEWLRFLLEHLGGEAEVKIGFLGENIEWFEDGDFQDNNFEFQKKLFQFLPSVKPVGKVNFEVLKDAPNFFPPGTDQAIFFFTDEKGEALEIFLNISVPIIFFRFGDMVDSPLSFLSSWSGGFVQKLFYGAVSLIEKEEFLQKLKFWHGVVPVDAVREKLNGAGEVLPKELRAGVDRKNIFFVGRKLMGGEKISFAPLAQFLPKLWASRRIAEILEKASDDRPDEISGEEVDALLAIGKTFGVKTAIFGPDTMRSELSDRVKNLGEGWDFFREIFRLDTLGFSEGSKFVNAAPFYESKDGAWKSFDFFDRTVPEMLISIAPFSEAQKNLFIHFPELLAENFGVGREVSFCLEVRCIEVHEGAREVPSAKDGIFLKSLDAPTWARDYFVRAVESGILEPGEKGELDAGKIVTRGEFSSMINEQLSMNNGENPPVPQSGTTPFSKGGGMQTDPPPSPFEKGGNERGFSDVPEISEFYESVMSLAERGVVKGYDDGTFRPLNLLTRAEAVKIILAAQGFVPTAEEGENPPVSAGADSTSPFPKGGGVQTNSPSPFGKGGNEGGFFPFPDTTGWEVPWVREAVKRKFVSGYHDGFFRPHQTLTRAESLKLLFEGLK